MSHPRPISLTLAGSDSGGGAGIQADLKTFHAFGVFGTSVVCAVTAQNTLGVRAVHAVPLDVVEAQIDALVEDLPPDAGKTGMLATSALVDVVARGVDRLGLERLVVDPVMVASSGDRLLDRDAEDTLLRVLVPRAALLTPNLAEASILTGRTVDTVDGMRKAARTLVDGGAGAVLVKGGHLDDEAVDLLWDGAEERLWRRPRIATRHTHGTGCTLSAAVAAGLALGRPLPEAVDRAVTWLAEAIRTAPRLGRGHGPVNHFAPIPGGEPTRQPGTPAPPR